MFVTTDLETSVEFFGRHGWLSGFEEPVRRSILKGGRTRRFAAGDMIYRIGEEPDGVYGLMIGSLMVSLPSDAGTVFDCYFARPGFWIGDSALFSNATRLVSLTAVSDVKCWHLSRTRIIELLRSDSSMYEPFYALNHRNMASLIRILANLAIPDSARRLIAWFLFSADDLPSTSDWIAASQEQIAMQNNLSLPTARRLLKRFEKDGLIDQGYGQVRIRDRAKMQAFSQT
jgi:CRP/FNR family transcriptional regulator, cyclic AMP receptor protein